MMIFLVFVTEASVCVCVCVCVFGVGGRSSVVLWNEQLMSTCFVLAALFCRRWKGEYLAVSDDGTFSCVVCSAPLFKLVCALY